MEDLEVKVAEIDQRCKSNTKRIDTMEHKMEDYQQTVRTVDVLLSEFSRMKDDMSEIKAMVKEIASKPAKRWDSIVEKILLGIVAALLAVILGKIGLV